MSFNEDYRKIKQLATPELAVIEEKMSSSIRTREPLNSYIVNFLTAPSKRVRPLLAILYTKACGQNVTQQQSEVLTAIELVHNASLIHDDIIDESDLRRGRKTVQAQFGNKLGVIAGDYILSVAMEKVAALNDVRIIAKFAQTLKQMCLGEINQNFDKFKIGTIEDYIEKSKNKTAYLFETALVCCAMLSSTPMDLESLSKLGLNIGIAFQIRDDLLNLANTDPSKPSNNDIAEGIYNAPVIYAGSVRDYAAGIEKTRSLLNNYIKEALQLVENLPVNDFSTALKEFLELLNNV